MTIQCPICGTRLEDVPPDYPPRPFCSKRCKQLDLANWLNEKYVLSRPLTPEDDDLLH